MTRKPDYQRGNVSLYLGDCLEILPTLEEGIVDAVVTDPVWPNALPELVGSDDPHSLLSKAAAHFPRLANRCVVHMGCDSDPRFLTALPESMPFLRVCWLRYARPCYKGRTLVTSEVAYVFGKHAPASVYQVAPGEMVHTRSDKATMRHTKDGDKGISYEGRHPCPRQTSMVSWLVKWFGGDSVLDPFMGSGTTGIASIRNSCRFVGIEIEPSYFEIASRRISNELDQQRMF